MSLERINGAGEQSAGDHVVPARNDDRHVAVTNQQVTFDHVSHGFGFFTRKKGAQGARNVSIRTLLPPPGTVQQERIARR